MNISKLKELDKFYTKDSIAKYCFEEFTKLIHKDYTFVEPSAGSGAFLKFMPKNRVSFDLSPELSEIIKLDFLKDDIKPFLPMNPIFLGNPPFGKKSKLAIEFLNKCLEYSDCVGFIVPLQFRKWSVQRNINKSAKLILDLDLEENAFELNGKDYSVRCCFQVWCFDSFSKNKDLRKKMPIIEHDDFKMYQYNRTEEALKYFDYDWDFAVIRQGYHDYTKKYYSKEECDKKQQWIFFKAKNKRVLGRLLNLNFEKLSKLNTSTPGFGKGDVVKEYMSLYKSKKTKLESLFEE